VTKPSMRVRRGVWALARSLHRNQLPGEKEKNVLAACQLRPLFRPPTQETLRVFSARHSFPSRLHWKPTVHKSVPKPTAPAPFKATRGSPSWSQARFSLR